MVGEQKISATAIISMHSKLGAGVRVWDYSQIREDATVGDNSIIGRSVYIGPGVKIGSNCKIQNNALIYEPALIENGVFIGPAVVLTNDQYPRAVNPDGTLKNSSDWSQVGVIVKEGASIGAQSVCIAPVVIGKWALVAAGSTVVREVPDFALVAGTPAKQIGWVGKSGHRLQKINDHQYQCPVTLEMYFLSKPGYLEAN